MTICASLISVVKMNSHVLGFLIAVLLGAAFAGNVLFLNGASSPSHHVYNRALVLGLSAKGHNVTFVSADLAKKEVPNVHYVHLERAYDVYLASSVVLDLAYKPAVETILALPLFCDGVCEGILASKGLEQILNYPEDFKFDVVIYDFTFGACLLPLVARFNNPPLVSISAFANPPHTTEFVGGQNYPAYVPHYVTDYSTEMTFFQRVFNTFLYFIDWM